MLSTTHITLKTVAPTTRDQAELLRLIVANELPTHIGDMIVEHVAVTTRANSFIISISAELSLSIVEIAERFALSLTLPKEHLFSKQATLVGLSAGIAVTSASVLGPRWVQGAGNTTSGEVQIDVQVSEQYVSALLEAEPDVPVLVAARNINELATGLAQLPLIALATPTPFDSAALLGAI